MAGAITPVYLIQPAFTTGEISKKVASRVDLDKYKSALLRARNGVIQPYGPVYKRQGSEFIGETKYSNKKAILVKFNNTETSAYFLEFGDLYVRIWIDGAYTGTELVTPFTEADLFNLRFTQSADTLFICSGAYPIYTLQRYANGWDLQKYKFSEVPFETINTDTAVKVKVSVSGSAATVTANSSLFSANDVGRVLKVLHSMPQVTVSAAGAVLKAIDTKTTITDQTNYGMEVNVDSYSTDTELSWRLITHGTWAGTIKLKKSSDGGTTWDDYRCYSSASDYNAEETGIMKRNEQLKVELALTSGSASFDLSIQPYDVYGLVLITGYTSATVVTGLVLSGIGKADTYTSDFYFSTWGKENGYPKVCAFFQDRFVCAGSASYQYKVWMSRSGDYANYGVERVSGTVTDDSAITLSLINREELQIQHLVTGEDLVILTSGNEWIISGSETVTPSKCTPLCQTQRGSSSCTVQYIGNRIVHVLRRGGTVRDMGYDYASNTYDGVDLTLLAKHLAKDVTLLTSTYNQEPDSVIYYVRDDGQLNCLTYIREQDVYGWSHWDTDGAYEYAVSIPDGQKDVLYVLVNRTINGVTKRYIERFLPMLDSSEITDYRIMDCYKTYTVTNMTISAPHLAGKEVQILVDGKRMPDVTVGADGSITTLANGTALVGLKYVTQLEQPNVEMQMRDGTLQGRTKKITSAILRLENSKGGKIGPTFTQMDKIPESIDSLYSGDIKTTIPSVSVGYNTDGRVCIYHDEPYPFNLLAIIREVSIASGAISGTP